MSWLDAVQSELEIITGDGKSYKPLWKNSCAKEIEYNIAQFDFPKVQGSKIDRGTPTARKFSLEIYFQGDDNLVTALNFEISARDSRPWKVTHPIYGSILVQPISLRFDYSSFNACQITGSLLETLGSAGLKIGIVAEDKIAADKQTSDDKVVEGFNAEMELMRARELTPSDIASRDLAFSTRQVTALKGINLSLYNIGVKQVKLTEDAGKYLDFFNVANASIDRGLAQSSEIMSSLQAVINFPSQMVTSLILRSSVISNQFSTLQSNIVGAPTQADKINYEHVGGTLVSSMANNAIATPSDYKTKKDVLQQIETIQDIHSSFMTDLDGLQTANAGSEDSYIPNESIISSITDLINFTIANLYQIALSKKQERIVLLEDDSNIIILAHRFYGLLVDDSTITQFMENNNICQNEMLQIRKGRLLSFYI
jgi:hypothetical protein